MGRGEHWGDLQWVLEKGLPGKEELHSYLQRAVFPVAGTEERKVQRSLLPKEELLAPVFPLEMEAGERSSGWC